MALSQARFTGLRRRLLADVRGNTLEIGIGTGLNIPCYPDSLQRLVAVDPNPGMHRMAERRARSRGITVERRLLAGEHLPFGSAVFDSVVSTFTLCSVADPPRVLGEIRRVLKPEGRFYFLEHGLSPEARIRKWQRRLTPLQKRIGDGCHLDRDIEALIRSSGFDVAAIERFYLDKTPRVAGYLYLGAARPEAAR